MLSTAKATFKASAAPARAFPAHVGFGASSACGSESCDGCPPGESKTGGAWHPSRSNDCMRVSGAANLIFSVFPFAAPHLGSSDSGAGWDGFGSESVHGQCPVGGSRVSRSQSPLSHLAHHPCPTASPPHATAGLPNASFCLLPARVSAISLRFILPRRWSFPPSPCCLMLLVFSISTVQLVSVGVIFFFLLSDRMVCTWLQLSQSLLILERYQSLVRRLQPAACARVACRYSVWSVLLTRCRIASRVAI